MHYYPGYAHCRSNTTAASAGGGGGGGGVGGGGADPSTRWRSDAGGGGGGGCDSARGAGGGGGGGGSSGGDPDDSGDSTLSDDRDESDSNSGTSGIEVDPDLPYPGIARLSMGYLTQTTRPRSWCLALITNPWFERISMIIILLNCVTLGMYQPCVDYKCLSNYRCQILQVFDGFIFAFFSLEMTVKMVAMGVWGRGTYLADSWNRLDLFIVLAGGLEYCLNVQNINLSAIRTIRVLRPLRAINRIPSMRILVMLLLDTLPMLGNVLLLCFFVFFIFGIVGVQLWQGILRQRCFMGPANFTLPSPNTTKEYKVITLVTDLSHYYTIPQETDYICSKADHSGMHVCSDIPPYRINNTTCNLTYEEYYEAWAAVGGAGGAGMGGELKGVGCINWNQYYVNCIEGDSNPAMGTISFDNIGLAWVAIFLVISLEGWSEIMYNVQDAHSFWDWIYFVLLIVIGSFFMINLCLVVIATQFSETKKREMERMRLERARFQSSSTLASSTGNSGEPSSCYAEIVKYIAHLWRRGRRRLVKKVRLLRYRRERRREQKIVAGETIRLHCGSGRRHHPCCSKVGIKPGNQQHPQQIISNPSHQSVSRTSSVTISEQQVPPPPPSPRGDHPPPSRTEDSSDNTATSTATQKRPSLLRVPSISNQEINSNNYDSPTNLLSPPVQTVNRRRSSVMFSDIVLLHGEETSNISNTNNGTHSNGGRNVCSSEKMTQTGDGNIWQITSLAAQQQLLQNQQAATQEYCELMNGETMTCQELLALGAINAALPTGQIALDSFFNNLSKEINSRKSTLCDDTYHNSSSNTEEDFSCCQDMWQCDSGNDYTTDSTATRSKCYVITCLVVKTIFRSLKFARRCVKRLVDHRYFQRGILLAILINTLSMGVEYHDQPEHMTNVVELSNIVFSAIFACEMLLKVVAEGPFGYIANGFNVFDGVIVILSAVELFKSFSNEASSHGDSSGLSVLRTFRLLRILKLVRFMPNLRRQLFVMLRTMDNVAVFFSLLILFIFIFSILGMYLFGGKFCKYVDEFGVGRECTCEMIVLQDKRCECDRKHFNNFLWATVTVFQILTQEDWNMVLASGMAKTSHWAALYFVALMTFGNYVLFNLLVAILVEGFSSERNERREREQREMARRKMSIMLESGGGFRDSSDESNRSLSSSSGSFTHESKNFWRSAEELRKIKDYNGQKPAANSFNQCACNELAVVKDCYSSFSDHTEPKCNIQKESYMLKQPRQTSPPIITHTAATPQDSPCNTLEDLPEFRFSITSCIGDLSSQMFDVSVSNSSDINRKYSSGSIPGLLKPPSSSPPPKTFRLEIPQEDLKSSNVSVPSLGSNVSSPFPESLECKEKSPEKIQKSPWKIASRPSLRRKKKNRSGSESEAIPLNNGRDHSQCNGGGVTRHLSLRNDSLLQSSIRIQNDTQKDKPNNTSTKGLSPQNSFRCRSHTYSSVPQVAWTPALARHNSLTVAHSVQPKISACNVPFTKYQHTPVLSRKNSFTAEPKSINNLTEKSQQSSGGAPIIDIEKTLPSVKLTDIIPEAPEVPMSKLVRLFLFLEPKGCMKEKDEYSLYLFAPNNRMRIFCNWFVSQKWFDNLVLFFIALNCITLAMERPVIPANSPERMFLSCSNYLFTFVFSVEMFVKVVAWGMCYGPDAYFTSGWNIMDGSLVVISIVDLLMSILSESSPRIFGILRVFRLLRSLRPLRVINRAPGLKLVVQTLLSSLRPIGNIVLICCTFFIIFGILGVQLFKGTFFYCKGDNNRGVHNSTECRARGNEWVNQEYNFDHLGRALMSLFVLSSRDGWVNIMYTGIDAVGVDQQPQVNYSEWRLLYFISFILLVGFFVLNMFVGVVVENFHRCREEQEKEERIRRAAKRALQMEKRRKKMNEPPYYINYSQWRMFIHNVVTSKYFDLAIAAVIGLNVVTMATESYKMPEILQYILKIFNYFFTAVFILESTMKLVALGFMLYMKDKWNQLDVLIVILSVLGIILEELKHNIIPINPTVLRVMRVMRIARVLKLLKMAKGIRALLDTVMQALPQVGNLGLLFFLLFFIFAALGVELFGRLDCKELPCQGLGEHADFSNFGMAFLTLFRVATGDNWNGIMKDTLRVPCDEHVDCVKNCCISPIIAPIFFVIFVLMAQFVLVNVVVAVLMKHLEESHKHLEDEQDMDNQLEREFQEKQEMEERRELCLALQLDSECLQPHYKPLTKVLSLPSNFTYNPPGSRRSSESHGKLKGFARGRRQTLHSQQPLNLLSTMDDIRDIDESTSDIYSIQEVGPSHEELSEHTAIITTQQTNTTHANLDDIVIVNDEPEEISAVRSRDTSKHRLLALPVERECRRPPSAGKLYGSTKYLFAKSIEVAEDESEETPFLTTTTSSSLSVPSTSSSALPARSKMPKNDSQESVQRIISERRKLDDTLKDINTFDIFEVSNGSEENLVDSDCRRSKEQ